MNGRLVFMGTAPICIPFLTVLTEHFDIPLIISQPDRPAGRNRQLCISCVKRFALDRKIPIIQPQTLKDPDPITTLNAIEPDIAVVIAFGQWIPPAVFRIPRHRTLNVHFSLLPQYRGAAPVQRAIQDGRDQTGVTIFELCSKMDAGPIWEQYTVEIRPQDTTETLWDRISPQAALVLRDTILRILNREGHPVPQDEMRATSAPMISKDEGRISWSMPAQWIKNTLRAFTPWPGIYFDSSGRQIKVISAQAVDCPHHSPPGQILSLNPQYMDVACGAHSLLRISTIQAPGKTPMSPFCYTRGNVLGPILG